MPAHCPCDYVSMLPDICDRFFGSKRTACSYVSLCLRHRAHSLPGWWGLREAEPP